MAGEVLQHELGGALGVQANGALDLATTTQLHNGELQRMRVGDPVNGHRIQPAHVVEQHARLYKQERPGHTYVRTSCTLLRDALIVKQVELRVGGKYYHTHEGTH